MKMKNVLAMFIVCICAVENIKTVQIKMTERDYVEG